MTKKRAQDQQGEDRNGTRNAGSSAPPTEIETRFCREYWTGDSKDGQYTNGDGYHYYEMQSNGDVLDAYEYYETDDGEEHVSHLPELIGVNWFQYFGFDDDELLEAVAEQEFEYVRNLPRADRDDPSTAR
jgi:hypothetical protein